MAASPYTKDASHSPPLSPLGCEESPIEKFLAEFLADPEEAPVTTTTDAKYECSNGYEVIADQVATISLSRFTPSFRHFAHGEELLAAKVLNLQLNADPLDLNDNPPTVCNCPKCYWCKAPLFIDPYCSHTFCQHKEVCRIGDCKKEKEELKKIAPKPTRVHPYRKPVSREVHFNPAFAYKIEDEFVPYRPIPASRGEHFKFVAPRPPTPGPRVISVAAPGQEFIPLPHLPPQNVEVPYNCVTCIWCGTTDLCDCLKWHNQFLANQKKFGASLY
jgi:hypothetical protein